MNLEVDKLTIKKGETQIAQALDSLKFLAKPQVVAAVFLLFYALFGLLYYGQGQQQEDIATELFKAQRILRKVPQDRLALEDRLTSAQQALDLERETFPSQQPTDVLLDYILQMADESGVKVLNTKIVSLREESIEQINYVVSPFDVQARGSMSQISSFLQLLEEGPLPALMIGTVNLSKSDLGFSLGVSFSVYGRGPIPDTNPPTSRARELSPFEASQGLIQVNVPYVAWDESGEDEAEHSGVDYVELYYRVDGETDYSKYTSLDNPEGQWTESPIHFTIPSVKAFEIYTIAVDKVGNKEEVSTAGADIVSSVEVNS